MKLLILLLTACILLTACSHSNKKIKETLSNADSVAINYFTGDGKMDSVTSVKIVRDKKIIGQLTDQVSQKNISGEAKCGYDGSIHYFKKNVVVQDIFFRMNDDKCMQFTFSQDKKMISTELSKEAKKLLEELK